MFEQFKRDVRAVKERDPAARSTLEILLCYPGFHAVRSHRRAFWLHTHGFKLPARIVSQLSRFFTGIEIHPAAVIGQGFFIDHGMGVVIGETTVIGDNVTLYQGATLGGTGKETGKRHPTIGNNVVISSGARVLGPFKVGDYAKIGAGAVVLKEVPPYSTVVGVPGRVVKRAPCIGKHDCVLPDMDCEVCERKLDAQRSAESEPRRDGIDLDQVNLPDPVMIEIEKLHKKILLLEAEIKGKEAPHEDIQHAD